MKHFFMCILFALVLLSQATPQNRALLVKDYQLQLIKKLSRPDGTQFKYFATDKDVMMGPMMGNFLDSENVYIFDPETKLVYEYDDNLNYLRTKNFQFSQSVSITNPKFLKLTEKFLFIGDEGNSNQYISAYEIDKGFIGYYFFENGRSTGYQNEKNQRIHFIDKYGFYFKEPGVIEWLEKPLTKTEIISGQYKNLIKTTLKNVNDTIIKINNTNITIKPAGVLCIEDIPLKNSWQNLYNFNTQNGNIAPSFFQTTDLIHYSENKILWKDELSIISTTDLLIENALFLFYEDISRPQLINYKPYPNMMRPYYAYSKKYGIIGLSVGYKVEGSGGLESWLELVETNLLKINMK